MITVEGHSTFVDLVAISNDRVISWSKQDVTLLITAQEVEDWELMGADIHSGQVSSISVSRDRRRLLSSGDGSNVIVWGVRDVRCTQTLLKGHTRSVKCISMTEDELWVASASMDSTVRAWTLQDGKWLEDILKEHMEAVLAVAICEENARVVSGAFDNNVGIWDLVGRHWRFWKL